MWRCIAFSEQLMKTVWVRKFQQGGKWIAQVIVDHVSNVTYQVKVSNGSQQCMKTLMNYVTNLIWNPQNP